MTLSALGIFSAAGAGGPVFPATLNPILWLDAADASTITQAGGAVSQWNNKGSLGNFTQASGALQPITNASTVNGKNVIDFAGDYLVAVNQNEWKPLHDGTKYFVAMAVKFGTVANPNTLYAVFSNHNGNASTIGHSIFYDDRSSASRNDRIDSVYGNGDLNFYQAEALTADAAYPPNTFTIYHEQSDTGNATMANRIALYRNGGVKLTTTSPNASVSLNPSTSNPSNPLTIGAFGDGGFSLTGSIGEIIVVSGTNATDANRDLVRDYLNTKWAVY